MKSIPLGELKPHPKNPRLAPRADVIEQIAAQINGEFDPAHALIVRKNCEGYEIISGHHRALAAQKAGLKEVPCWIRELSDDDAYMALALNNAQGELHELEIGIHALGSGMGPKEYAERLGKSRTGVQHYYNAARVATETHMGLADLTDYWRHLSEMHSSPKWLWRALVSRLVAEKWTVEIARREVQKFKEVGDPPEWADHEAVAKRVVTGDRIKPSEVKQFSSKVVATEANLIRNAEDADRLVADLRKTLAARRPSLLSDVDNLCNAIEREQRDLIDIRQQAEMFSRKQKEEDEAKVARLRRNVSLDEWKGLTESQIQTLFEHENNTPGQFNKQSNDAIEWAQWSWNPVTGCMHTCSYCYARDIALGPKMEDSYPNGFAPTFRPGMLLAPRTMKVPKEAATDTRYRNVFTCSMADLFGRWVPKEWIQAILDEIRAAPQWNFLCLTKFPKRMAEFDIPDNAWMGTTVDLQARVPAAEAAFAKVNAGVKWLSVEPMLEPLKFKNLERFDWVVIGGSSSSRATDGSPSTPKWVPPVEWVIDLYNQARAAGCKIYFKTNLGMEKRVIELPFDAPVPSDNTPAPKEFHYLGKGVE